MRGIQLEVYFFKKNKDSISSSVIYPVFHYLQIICFSFQIINYLSAVAAPRYA